MIWPIRLFDIDIDHKREIEEIVALPRVGINQSDPEWAQKKLRFIVSGNPYVSDIKKKDIKKIMDLFGKRLKSFNLFIS